MLPSWARFNQSSLSRSSWLIPIRSILQPYGCQEELSTLLKPELFTLPRQSPAKTPASNPNAIYFPTGRELTMRMMRMKFGPAAALLLATIPLIAQTAPSRIPRMPDSKPNLNGIWQTMNTANWDLLTHGPAMSPVVAMGAQGATPPGIGVVEGNEIPYLPAAAKIK